jgi:hypothetical protein
MPENLDQRAALLAAFPSSGTVTLPRQVQWGRWANVTDAQSAWSTRQEGLEPKTRYSGFFAYLGHFAMSVTRVALPLIAGFLLPHSPPATLNRN